MSFDNLVHEIKNSKLKNSFIKLREIVWIEKDNAKLTAEFIKTIKSTCSIPIKMTNGKVKLIGSWLNTIFILKYDKKICLSISHSHPLFWYYFTDKNSFMRNFDNIVNTYNQVQYNMDFANHSRGMMGTEEILGLSIYDIENHLILNDYCEKLLWGSLWRFRDHPFRNQYSYDEVTHSDSIVYTGQAMRQIDLNTYSVSVRSQFSKSIITIEKIENSFIIDILYNPIKSPQIENINKELSRGFPIDLPIDVVITLINFPFVTHLQALKMKPIKENNFIIAIMIADNVNMSKDLVHPTKEIINKIKDENGDNNIVQTAKTFLEKIYEDIIIDDIYNSDEIISILDNKDDDAILAKTFEYLITKHDCQLSEELKKVIEDNIKILINAKNMC